MSTIKHFPHIKLALPIAFSFTATLSSCMQIDTFSCVQNEYVRDCSFELENYEFDHYIFHLWTAPHCCYRILKEDGKITIQGDSVYTCEVTGERKSKRSIIVLPHGDKKIDNMLRKLLSYGEFPKQLYGEVTPNMEFIFLPVDKRNRHTLRWRPCPSPQCPEVMNKMFSDINVYLYSLLPELHDVPAWFPGTKNPPPHVEGKMYNPEVIGEYYDIK